MRALGYFEKIELDDIWERIHKLSGQYPHMRIIVQSVHGRTPESICSRLTTIRNNFWVHPKDLAIVNLDEKLEDVQCFLVGTQEQDFEKMDFIASLRQNIRERLIGHLLTRKTSTWRDARNEAYEKKLAERDEKQKQFVKAAAKDSTSAPTKPAFQRTINTFENDVESMKKELKAHGRKPQADFSSSEDSATPEPGMIHLTDSIDKEQWEPIWALIEGAANYMRSL